MAKVKIQGHASGTGIFTVTAPDSDTNRTITLPDGTGTLAFTTGDDDKLPLAGGTLTGNTNLTKNSPVFKVNESGGGDVRIHATGSAGGIGTYSNHTFSILTNSTARLNIDNSGSIGIGVTPESWHSNYLGLQVKNASLVGSGTTGAGFGANCYWDSTNNRWEYIGGGQANLIWNASGTTEFKVAPSGSADAAITWTTPLSIGNGGDVTFGSSITETETTKTSSFTPNLTTDGTIFDVSGGITVTMPSATAGKSFTIIDAGTGTLAWSGTILWPSATAPSPSGKTIYSFISNGTNWYGMMAGTGFA